MGESLLGKLLLWQLMNTWRVEKHAMFKLYGEFSGDLGIVRQTEKSDGLIMQQ